MRILLASSNPHKIEEINAVWASLPAPGQQAGAGAMVTLIGLSDLGMDIDEPVEDQPTFEGNAVLKARHYADAAGMRCIADDSGLEVDALGGEPGVISARYAGATGPRSVVDPANNALLLERLGDAPSEQRTARFVCVMAMCDPTASEPLAVVRGTVEGRIIGPGESPRGENGFGYDPLFFLPDRGCTTAELSPAEKNAISHRGDASRLMWAKINGMAGIEAAD